MKVQDRSSWTHAYQESAASENWLTNTLPMVEIFQTVEGEGTQAGYPTVFVRVFHCNLRCTWCDTPYSYAPAKPAFDATIRDIADRVANFGWEHVCLTGGEPLIHRHKSQLLIDALAALETVKDIHIETNGAIDIRPFADIRNAAPALRQKVRFILDFKLPGSGEMDKMILDHFGALTSRDEIKFVIADDKDFETAMEIVNTYVTPATILFSPVWETMPPAELVKRILDTGNPKIKLNMQIHKVIWDPQMRGV